MRLIRHGDIGSERPGVILADGRMIDVSAEFPSFDEVFFASGGIDLLRSWIVAGCHNSAVINDGARLAAPIDRPSKIICVGKNYADHAKEFGGGVPDEPVLFMKASSAYCGPNDDVILPPGCDKLDYEVELAVVIGKACRRVAENEAINHIAGYTIICDYSERAWQNEHSGQWVKGKSSDTFAPLGPCMVTTDELTDTADLSLWSKVNGESRQNGRSSDMIFSVPFLVSYISRFMTLLPGDVIATGTPGGVGMGYNPPRYLSAGDQVEQGIEGIGSMCQCVSMDD